MQTKCIEPSAEALSAAAFIDRSMSCLAKEKQEAQTKKCNEASIPLGNEYHLTGSTVHLTAHLP